MYMMDQAYMLRKLVVDKSITEPFNNVDSKKCVVLDREQLIKDNIPLVKSIANKLFVPNKGLEFDDLVNTGILGLIDAVNRFDVERDAKFSTYSYIRIKGAILDEIRRQQPISKQRISRINNYNKVVENLRNKLFKEPSIGEIADELNITKMDVSEIETDIDMLSTYSLDKVIFEDTSENIERFLKISDDENPSSIVDENEKAEILSKAISNLKDKEQLVLSLYYYDELNLKEIASVLKVSESRVSQLHRKAITNLKCEIDKMKYSVRND
ncbi:FliA/WhiG family RNA polymerase sigma factor [Metaclostridioides mangenotii]